MGRDVTYLTAGGSRRHSLTGLSRWLAIGLGGALVFALILAQAVRADSHTAELSALSLDGTAVTGFDADTTSYTHIVYDALNAPDDKITVAATANPTNDSGDDVAKAVISPADAVPDDGDDTTTADAGHQVDLVVGENTIEIVVTSAGGESTRTYTVKVTRVAASDASLSALSLGAAGAALSPGFDADTEMYTASVANSVADTTVTATPTHTSATATIIPASPVTLNVGENTIKVVVRAVDGTVKTYTVVVTKAASDDARLATLTVGTATLAPAFDPAADPFPTRYTTTVGNDVSQVTVAATKADTEAEDPVIRPADVDSIAGGHQVNLAVGSNTITVMVEAEDGTMATYTVVVTRSAAVSTDAVLSDLSLAQADTAGTAITLTPGFVASTTSYTATVYDALNAPIDKVAVTAAVGAGAQRVISPPDADTATDGHQVNLRVGETTITARVTVTGATQDYTIKVTRVAASDASLSALSLGADGAALSPDFDADTDMYTASVANSVTETTVTATPTHTGATATVVPTSPVTLNVGENTIKVVVRSVDGSVKTYTVVVTRAGSAATLTALTLADSGGTDQPLTPAFDAAADPMVYEHTASVANAVDRVTVTATKADTAKDPVISPADADAASMDTHEVDLMVGENTIMVMVEAEDGSMNTFTITVTRAGSPDATLSALSLSGIDLNIDGNNDPASDPTADQVAAATSVMVTVPRHVDSTTVSATATDTAASVEYMPADADMAMNGHQVALGLGKTEITVMVTSSDMTTTSTYTITVNRRHSDVSLKSLSLGDDVTLVPAFDAGTMDYTASVASTVASVIVMAAPTDADATVDPAAAAEAAGNTVTLAAGENTITLTVTSSDTTAQNVYTVKVFQVHVTANLTALSLGDDIALMPEFDSNLTMYSAMVDYDTMQVTVAATAVSGASAEVQDADGMAIEDADADADGHQVNLDVGANTIVVAVTGGDPAVTTPYTVVVTRGQSTDATLSELSLSGITLDPTFDPATTSYTASVANDFEHTMVTAMATHADATVEAPAGQIDLAEGPNTIMVTVTAADGSTTMTYTVVVARAVLVLDAVPVFSPASASVELAAGGGDVSHQVPAATGGDGNLVYTSDAAAPLSFDAATRIVSGTVTASATVVVTATDEDGDSGTYTLVITVPEIETVTVEVEVPGPTVVHTRTVTRTETVEVEVPAPPNVIGGSMTAMATLVDGRVLITRHDGGPSLVVDIGGFIRDASLGQTYQVVQRMDGMIVRQWVSPNSPLVYQIPWSIVNTQFTVPVGVIMAIPLDDQSGSEGQLVRRFDGSGDDRIFSYAGMGQWRHVPDIATFQQLGFYWCDVTAADSAFFDRVNVGPPHPASMDMSTRDDYPSCSTG